MKNFVFVSLFGFVISGCVPQEFLLKQSVTYDRYERDITECQTQATQKVPTNTQVGWAPYVGIYSTDTNSELRQRNYSICMRDKGYSEVTLQPCQGAASDAAYKLASLPRDRSRLLTVGKGTCWIVRSDGSAFVFTPAEVSN